MWVRFEKVAAKLHISVSEALMRAADEWSAAHENDPSPDPVLPKDKRRNVIDFNPFETMADAPVAPPRRDPFAAAEKERDNL